MCMLPAPIDPYYSYQLAQYYQLQQQQVLYYQQYYEQQLQNNANLEEIEQDACKDDSNLTKIQKIINNDQQVLSNRSKAHVKAIFFMNKMIKIPSNNVRDGQSANVEIYSLNDLVDYEEDENNKKLQEFPGPLIK